MRICILTRPDLFPMNHGAAVKIVQTARNLAQLSNNPCFIVTEDRDEYWKLEQTIEKCQIPRNSRAKQEWLFLPHLSRMAEKLCGIVGYPEEEYFLYSPQFDPAWLVRVVLLGLQEEIDVFQAEFPGYGIVAAMASRIIATIKMGKNPISSIVQHNVEWDRLESFGVSVQRIKKMELLALNMVHDVIAVSSDDKNRMVAAGIPDEKITVIPHGVDFKTMQEAKERRKKWRQHWNISDHHIVLFFHGTLHYMPNTEAVRFIAEQLIPVLDEQLPEYKIVITGMNPPLYYAHERIVFTDAVEDLAGHIHMADVCICPLFAGGGTRLKLLEYMAAGKAIVSTQKGAEGIPFHGQLRYAETAHEFAQEIIGILDDEQQRTVLEQRALAFASRLSWPMVTQAYVDLYHGLNRGKNWSKQLLQPQLNIAEYLPIRSPSKPLTLLLLLNNGCNLRCTFCDLWEHHEHMPVDKLFPILDDAIRIGTKTLVLTGGEPLLHPDFFLVVKEAKKRGLSVNVTTNGTLLERHWGKIVNSGIDSLSFSLDGLAEVHDELRGQKGAFTKTVHALKRILAETDISCNVYFVTTNQNVHQLWDVYQLTKKLGASFDFWPVNDAPELYLKTKQEQRLWTMTTNRIMEDDTAYRARKNFYLGSTAYHKGEMPKKLRCLGFVDQYGITYKGELLPCCVWHGKGLVKGNVFQRSLFDLWYSQEVQAYRKSLVQDGCEEGCFNHSLYEFQQSTQLDFRVQ